MKNLVYGIGINDGSRPAKVASKNVKEYMLWTSMLSRCFSDRCKSEHPTYKVCKVSNNFLNYTFFYDWCQEQVGFGNIDEKGCSWQLDKDLLIVGNKTYSENSCVFAPQEINSFFIARSNDRGNYPIGVCFHKQVGKYSAVCSVNGKRQHLGYLNTPQEAFAVYKTFKEALCKELALKWQNEIDVRLFNAMMNWNISDTLRIGEGK